MIVEASKKKKKYKKDHFYKEAWSNIYYFNEKSKNAEAT